VLPAPQNGLEETMSVDFEPGGKPPTSSVARLQFSPMPCHAALIEMRKKEERHRGTLEH